MHLQLLMLGGCSIKVLARFPHNLIKESLLDLIERTFKRALKTVVHVFGL